MKGWMWQSGYLGLFAEGGARVREAKPLRFVTLEPAHEESFSGDGRVRVLFDTRVVEWPALTTTILDRIKPGGLPEPKNIRSVQVRTNSHHLVASYSIGVLMHHTDSLRLTLPVPPRVFEADNVLPGEEHEPF